MIYRLSSKYLCKRSAMLYLLVVFSLLPSYSQGKGSDIQTLINLGDNAYVANNVNEAAALYRQAYNLLPESNADAALKKAVEERYQKTLNVEDGKTIGAVRSYGKASSVQHHSYNISQGEINAANESNQALEKARQLYSDKQYEESLKEYNRSLALLPKRADYADRRKFIEASIADTNVVVAQQYMKVGRYDEAEQLLTEALKYDSSNKFASRTLATLKDPVRNNPAMTPQHAADVIEVNRLLNLGFGYYDLGKYDDAEKAFESILSIDKTNIAARRGMEQLHKRRQQYYGAARAEIRSSALAEVESKWGRVFQEADDLQLEEDLDSTYSHASTRPEDKLKRIIIPNIDFEGVDIVEAVDFLRRQAQNLDQADIAAERGVNIALNLGETDSEATKKILAKKFDLKMKDVSLDEAIKHITQLTGTISYVTEYTIEISSPSTNMPFVSRKIQVPLGFFSGMESGVGASEDSDPFADSTGGGGMSIKRVDPKEVLKKMGIPFPDGSAMQYNSANSSLYVYNSPQNIRVLEELVAARTTDQPAQVVINTTIIEVSESTLNELGFDWIMNLTLDANKWYGNGGNAASDGVAPLPDIPGLSMPKGGLMTRGLRSAEEIRHSDNIDNIIQYGASGLRANSGARLGSASGFLSVYGVWSDAQIGVVVRGLDQKKNVDILQKPQIIVRPGESAKIHIGRDFYYPEEYEPPEIPTNSSSSSGNNSNMMVTPAHPTSFIQREIGTLLNVEVTGVNSEKTKVDLTINPEIVEFDGFINYGSPITQPIIGYNNTGMASAALGSDAYITSLELTKNEILKPVFTTRRATTTLNVQTGSTVVFGAMKKSRMMSYEDKVPIFGDLPLVGRLFRSSGKQEEKQMVLMFVKAEIIDPGGKEIHTAAQSVLNDSLAEGLVNMEETLEPGETSGFEGNNENVEQGEDLLVD